MGRILKLDLFYITTSRQSSIACLYVNFIRNPKFAILYSHGNAEDIGERNKIENIVR